MSSKVGNAAFNESANKARNYFYLINFLYYNPCCVFIFIFHILKHSELKKSNFKFVRKEIFAQFFPKSTIFNIDYQAQTILIFF